MKPMFMLLVLGFPAIALAQQPQTEKLARKQESFVMPEPLKVTAEGKVVNAKTRAQVEAVLVFSNATFSKEVHTKGGAYHLALADSGDYFVKIDAPGYIGALQRLKIRTNSEFDFGLTPLEVGARVNMKSVLFQQSAADLLPESFPELNGVVEFLKANPSINIELAGYTDNRGPASLNLKLSEERAEAVKKYIVSKGIASSRIVAKGYGGTNLISQGSDEERKKNRRVEFVIIGK